MENRAAATGKVEERFILGIALVFNAYGLCRVNHDEC